MEQRTNFAAVTILRGIASVDFPEIGVKQGDRVYLARDGKTNIFACSCGKGPCEHKLTVNTFVFEESQKRRASGDDLAAHVTDEWRLSR